MEKQSNSEMTPNVEVSRTKSPMKKRSRVFLIISVFAMLLVACGSEPAPAVTTEKEKTTAEEAPIETAEPEEELPEQVKDEVYEDPVISETVSDDTLTIGSTINYTVGNLTILDAGILSHEYGVVLYVETELENTSDEAITLTSDNFGLYIDDYQVSADIGYRNVEEVYSESSYIEVNPGRKAKFTFRALLTSEYDNAEKIEVGFPGTQQTLFVKENGKFMWDQGSASNTEHDADGIIGEYTQVENPSITMSIYMDPSETFYILAVYFGDDRNSMVGFLDSGMILDYFNEDLDGFYEYDENGFVLNSCIDPDADGHYQK